MDETPQPGDRRPADNQGRGGESPRRLERPPGERYAAPGPGGAEPGPAIAPVRGILLAAGVGLIGSAASIVLVAVASVSAGLLVVAAVTGLFVGEALRAGAGATLTPGLRRGLAVSTALESVLAAQIGIWLYARAEGGALGLVDYLAEAFGPLVPLQLAIAALVAWWSAR
ncbi:MAG TPA: hypothetical protein VGQ58_00095 [Candidatus Limnocylindrales bacterium]|jgi:hypothetical protein|nr:hypothetical protein [Candidatus Limnocylindrales bacterium]